MTEPDDYRTLWLAAVEEAGGDPVAEIRRLRKAQGIDGACPRDPMTRCNHLDADRCCGGGCDGPCNCRVCHPLIGLESNDWRRLIHLAEVMDGVGDVDFHESAAEYAEGRGAEAAEDEDYIRAIRDGLDASIMESDPRYRPTTRS